MSQILNSHHQLVFVIVLDSFCKVVKSVYMVVKKPEATLQLLEVMKQSGLVFWTTRYM